MPAHVSLKGYLKLWTLTDTLIITNCFRISWSLYRLSSAAVLLTQSGSFGSGVSFQKIKVGRMKMSGWSRRGARGGRAAGRARASSQRGRAGAASSEGARARLPEPFITKHTAAKEPLPETGGNLPAAVHRSLSCIGKVKLKLRTSSRFPEKHPAIFLH